MIDTTEPTSPGWWLKRLMEELQRRRMRYDLLDNYYRGEPPLPMGPENCRATFRRFQKKARANWASLIVEAPRERMKPVGFRTAAEGDELGDAEAQRIWQANHLDADSILVHRASMSMSDAYVIVGDVDERRGVPLITGEDPRQVVTESDPIDRRRVVAALKVFADDVAEADLAYLYLPGVVHRAVRRRPPSAAYTSEVVTPNLSGWEWLDSQQLPVDGVPVVRFANRCDLSGRSLGEFEDVIDDIDRINLVLLQRLTVATMQAFRQRAITGDLAGTDEDGNPVDYDDVFSADPGSFWLLPEGVDIWESAGVDLTPLLESVKADVRDLAAVTRTPMFYLFPDAANGSAEGASLQREGLVFKTQDRITEASDSWAQVMSLAFQFAGDDQRADRADLEVLWQPPERFSLSERYDAATKAAAAGVPWRSVMADVLQFTPQQVDRMEAERMTEELFGAAPLVEPVEL